MGYQPPANAHSLVSYAAQPTAASTAFGAVVAPWDGTLRVLASASAAATLSLTVLGTTSDLGDLTAATWSVFTLPVAQGQAVSFEVSAAATVALQATLSPRG